MRSTSSKARKTPPRSNLAVIKKPESVSRIRAFFWVFGGTGGLGCGPLLRACAARPAHWPFARAQGTRVTAPESGARRDGPSMAQRGSPGIHAGMSPASGTSTRPAGGASRTDPQQRTSRDLRCRFLKANRRHKYHCSAFESALGSPPHPAGRVEVRLRRDGRHGCRPSPAGPRKAHRGVPCASVPERGNPERQRRANAGAATPRPARKQNRRYPKNPNITSPPGSPTRSPD